MMKWTLRLLYACQQQMQRMYVCTSHYDVKFVKQLQQSAGENYTGVPQTGVLEDNARERTGPARATLTGQV